MLSLLVSTNIQGRQDTALQQDTALKQARNFFAEENYWQAAAYCKESKKYPPKENMIRENLLRRSQLCHNLLNSCDIIGLNQIKEIRRSEYKLSNSPTTDAKIKDCEGLKPQPPKQNVQKLKFEPEKNTAKGSASLTDSIQLKIIYNFLNQFEDAFINKNIAFIDKVFGDKAIIITETNIYTLDKNGKKIKDDKKSKKTRIGKEEYLKNLKEAFDKNYKIYVDFSEIKIDKSNINPNIYGVNLLQTWLSESDSNFDESGIGWVFLNIDFNDMNKPTIWVKTWQNFETDINDRYYLDSVIE
jgi:hypothetical protein